MDTIQRYIAQLEREVRDADARISDLEQNALHEKVGGKIHIFHEISMIRRRREDSVRKLAELQAALPHSEVAA